MNRKVLGKGLGALIPDFEMGVPEIENRGSVLEFNVDDIIPNRYQPRQRFDDEKLNDLVESIRGKGVIQPVVVQKSEQGYELIVGERRWRACKKLGIKKIPAVLRESSDSESLEVALIENIHRQDLNPIEEAEAYYRLSSEFGLTQEEISKNVGKKRASIANYLRLLKLSQPIKEDLITGRLTMGHARALLGLSSEQDINIAWKNVVAKDLNVRQTEHLVKKVREESNKAPEKIIAQKDVYIKELEKELERKLGTKTEIIPGKKGGKLVVSYFSDEDLERIRGIIVK